MDTHGYDYWVQRMRLRSERQKKRMVHEDRDKQLIRKHLEEKAIWAEFRNLGWTELKPPIQRGFIRFFVLRPDVARTKDAPFFQKILDKINTTQWSSRGDFKKKRRRYGKKVYVDTEQKLLDVNAYDFRTKFSEKERLYFYESLTHFEKSKVTFRVFRFIETWRYVLHIQPNMITKVRVKDLDLESRREELDRFFNTEKRMRLWKLLYGRKTNWMDTSPNEKYDDPLINRSHVSILDKYWPDQQLKTNFQKNPRRTRGFCFIWYKILLFTSQTLNRIPHCGFYRLEAYRDECNG